MDKRISSHKYEIKFNDFCKDNNIDYSDLLIEYLVLQNSTEENVVEKMLINKNKPILNTADNHESISTFINFYINADWIKYENSLFEINSRKKRKRKYCNENNTRNSSSHNSHMDDWYMFYYSMQWLLSLNPDDNRDEIKNIPEINGKPYLSYFYITYGHGKNKKFIGVSFIKNTTIKKDGTKYTKLDRPLCEIIKLAPLFAVSMNKIRENMGDIHHMFTDPPYIYTYISDEQINNLIELL